MNPSQDDDDSVPAHDGTMPQVSPPSEALSRAAKVTKSKLPEPSIAPPDSRSADESVGGGTGYPATGTMMFNPVDQTGTGDADGRTVTQAAQSPSGTYVAPSHYAPQPVKPTGENVPLVGGRYRAVNVHAKGGMGQVVFAVDHELDRKVALKEIQPRYADDPGVAARFVLEAQVTGRLEHPGIVPVYGLNQYPDGRPFYVMRFITGESMQDAVHAFHKADENPTRDPRERTLALHQLLTRFVHVCNTLAFSHSRGFLHRDMKPANVMLGGYGETLVVDWGLAKEIGVPEPRVSSTENQQLPKAKDKTAIVTFPSERISADAPSITPNEGSSAHSGTQTELGQAMGTPAYMSPEQAQGQWDTIGPPADIYSLGATLYSIICGHSPLSGTVAEILNQVKRGEYHPARERNSRAPAALDAVCKKAMAFRPEDRYPTALALAADVERYLADEPISCYQETTLVRLGRWAKRHRTAVATTAAILLTGVGLLAVGLFLVNNEKNRTLVAKQETDLANASLVVEQDRTQKALTVATAARGDARDALLALTDDAIGEILTSQHAPTGQQKRFLETVITMYQRFIKESPDSPESKLFLAGAWYRVARLQTRLGHADDASVAFTQALGLVTADDQTGPEWKQLRGEIHLYRGIMRTTLRAHAEAEADYRTAGSIFRNLIDTAFEQKVPDKPDHWYRMGQADDRLGLSLYLQEQRAEAEEWFRAALTNRQVLADRVPTEPEYQFRLAQSLRQMAMVTNADGRRIEALAYARRSRDLQQKLLDDNPSSAAYLAQLADVNNQLALIVSEERLDNAGVLPAVAKKGKKNKDQSAIGYAEDSVKTWSKLVALYPADPGYREQLAQSNLNLAAFLHGAGKLREALNATTAAATVLQENEKHTPNLSLTMLLRGRAAHARGVLLRERDDLPGAAKATTDAVEIARELLQKNPDLIRSQSDLAYYQVELAAILLAMNDYPAAQKILGASWSTVVGVARATPDDPRAWVNVRGFGRVGADLLFATGKSEQLPRLIAQIRSIGASPAEEAFQAACLWGRAANQISQQFEVDEEIRAERISNAIAESLNALEAAINAGFRRREDLLNDADLVKVRPYADFERLLARIREVAPLPRAVAGQP